MQRTVFFAFLLLFLSAAASAQAPQPTSPPQTDNGAAPSEPTPLEQARTLAARGRLDKSMAILDQLAAQSPEPAGVERLRGNILYQKQQFPEAIAAYTRAAEQDPGDLESVEMRGVILFSQGHPAQAIPFLEKAHVAVERANVDPEYVLGLCYADVGRYDDARHAFATQYGFEPDSAEAYLLAARLFLRRELAAEAVVQAGKALELNPVLPLAHQLLAEAALAKADVATAIRELEAATQNQPPQRAAL